eukprot:6954135-Ditylum_brightwellii.AAC.1
MLVQHSRPNTGVGKNAACVLIGEGYTVDVFLAAVTLQNAHIMPQKQELKPQLPQHQYCKKTPLSQHQKPQQLPNHDNSPNPNFDPALSSLV